MARRYDATVAGSGGSDLRRTMTDSRIETLCVEKGMRMTAQRRIIARVLSGSHDHPDVEELHRRAAAVDSGISVSTVYRTVRLFEGAGIIERHDFREGRARYERATDGHHDHLIDIESGHVIEFQSDEIEALQAAIAERLGYRIVGHRLELYCLPREGGRRPSRHRRAAAGHSEAGRKPPAPDR